MVKLMAFCIAYLVGAVVWLWVADMSAASLVGLALFGWAHNLEKHWKP